MECGGSEGHPSFKAEHPVDGDHNILALSVDMYDIENDLDDGDGDGDDDDSDHDKEDMVEDVELMESVDDDSVEIIVATQSQSNIEEERTLEPWATGNACSVADEIDDKNVQEGRGIPSHGGELEYMEPMLDLDKSMQKDGSSSEYIQVSGSAGSIFHLEEMATEEHLSLHETKEKAINTHVLQMDRRRWMSGLCGCISDRSTCLFGLLCCGCQTMMTRRRLQLNEWDIEDIFWGSALCGCSCCLYLWCCQSYIEYSSRKKLRSLLQMPKSTLRDLCSTFVCLPCSVCQHAREIKCRELANEIEHVVPSRISSQ